jgi:hypothetical protein
VSGTRMTTSSTNADEWVMPSDGARSAKWTDESCVTKVGNARD